MPIVKRTIHKDCYLAFLLYSALVLYGALCSWVRTCRSSLDAKKIISLPSCKAERILFSTYSAPSHSFFSWVRMRSEEEVTKKHLKIGIE